MARCLSTVCLCALGALFLGAPAFAGELDLPQGKPILEVSGAISSTNIGETAVFDRVMLEALGAESITTKTQWSDGRTEFSGIRLAKLMEMLGAQGNSVTATALNDYVTTIPMTDFFDFDVILALKRDGEYMSVREKGPLFIVYDYDSDPVLQTQTYFARSAWQVTKLVVE
ncbi:molybdopterin-dependent oxidoreductase [Aurantimonas sp. A2-1-M11]|uniref:molybdopterin-dependent oxidoreductase n=1 Tax=Aurantimonas sp. A2-1-M11 TaxID=3113712 RepID=UPI002F9205E4